MCSFQYCPMQFISLQYRSLTLILRNSKFLLHFKFVVQICSPDYYYFLNIGIFGWPLFYYFYKHIQNIRLIPSTPLWGKADTKAFLFHKFKTDPNGGSFINSHEKGNFWLSLAIASQKDRAPFLFCLSLFLFLFLEVMKHLGGLDSWPVIVTT